MKRSNVSGYVFTQTGVWVGGPSQRFLDSFLILCNSTLSPRSEFPNKTKNTSSQQSELSTGKEGDQEGGVQVTQSLCCHKHMEMPWSHVHSGCQGEKALEALKGKFSALQGFLGLHRPCYLLRGKQRDNLSEVTQLNSH